jgi:hypothetical protein
MQRARVRVNQGLKGANLAIILVTNANAENEVPFLDFLPNEPTPATI